MQGKVWVSGGKASNEVVFVGLDGSFCQVSAVDASWGCLPINTFIIHEVFEQLGAFIVQPVELGSEAGLDE